jgi:hypothetical protein
MVTIVNMVAWFHISVFMVTLELGLCVTSYPGLHGLYGNVRALLVGDVAEGFVWFLWVLCFGGVPREYCGIPSCDGHVRMEQVVTAVGHALTSCVLWQRM